jgi:hypothetical protein
LPKKFNIHTSRRFWLSTINEASFSEITLSWPDEGITSSRF